MSQNKIDRLLNEIKGISDRKERYKAEARLSRKENLVLTERNLKLKERNEDLEEEVERLKRLLDTLKSEPDRSTNEIAVQTDGSLTRSHISRVSSIVAGPSNPLRIQRSEIVYIESDSENETIVKKKSRKRTPVLSHRSTMQYQEKSASGASRKDEGIVPGSQNILPSPVSSELNHVHIPDSSSSTSPKRRHIIRPPRPRIAPYVLIKPGSIRRVPPSETSEVESVSSFRSQRTIKVEGGMEIVRTTVSAEAGIESSISSEPIESFRRDDPDPRDEVMDTNSSLTSLDDNDAKSYVASSHEPAAFKSSTPDSGIFNGWKREAKPEEKPEFKLKKEAIILPPDTVRTYLQDIPHLHFDSSPEPTLVSRKYLSQMYGGNQQELLGEMTRCSEFPPRKAVFPLRVVNPYMPALPGQPGLIFASRHEILDGVWSVFTREEGAGPVVWRYLGEYESFLAGSLTPEEFASQNLDVQNSWAKLILKAKRWPAYTHMSARIYLRAHQREISQKSIEAVLDQLKNNTVGFGYAMSLTAEDVWGAFSRGEEAIDVLSMKCVAYDEKFAMHCRENYEKYKSKQEAPELPQKRKRGNHKGKGKAAAPNSYGSEESPSYSSRKDDSAGPRRSMRQRGKLLEVAEVEDDSGSEDYSSA